MKIYDYLKVEIKSILEQIFEVKNNELVNVLKKVKSICKEFRLISKIFKVVLVERRKKK